MYADWSIRQGCRSAQSGATRSKRKGVWGLMRKGRREVLLVLVVFLAGTMVRAARSEKGKPAGSEDLVGITVELSWTTPGGDARGGPGAKAASAPELTLGMTEGVVTEVVSWPPESSAQGTIRPGQSADGNWQLGPSGAGRVRARLEASAGADLLVRRGENLVRIPVLAILERPQHTPPQSPLTVSVERLPWDSLIVDLGQGAEDGMVAPSVVVPVVVKYNIVSPETAEVMVRTTAVLRQNWGRRGSLAVRRARTGSGQSARPAAPDPDGAGAWSRGQLCTGDSRGLGTCWGSRQ